MATYHFGTVTLSEDDEEFPAALARAHIHRLRPRCLCLVEGIEMYVARLDYGFIVKRMPNTGGRHAPCCLSYEPPPDGSGLGQLLGTAITEDPATGDTVLELGFAMSKFEGRTTMPAPGSPSDSVTSDGTKLSLRGLLHYLWDQAGLTRWQPSFAGKRSWGTVRKLLLLSAANKIVRGSVLRSSLYVPEVFSVEHRDAINARRVEQWMNAVAATGKPKRLMLLIGEVKEITSARFGFKVVIKHVPDQGLSLDGQLYRRLTQRFEAELTLWGSAENVQMIAIATFGVSEVGIPAIAELSMMPVTSQWLPIDDLFDKQLVERLVNEGRSFIKGLRYNLPTRHSPARATLTDVEGGAPMLWVVPPGFDGALSQCMNVAPGNASADWVWSPGKGGMPALPDRKTGRWLLEDHSHRGERDAGTWRNLSPLPTTLSDTGRDRRREPSAPAARRGTT